MAEVLIDDVEPTEDDEVTEVVPEEVAPVATRRVKKPRRSAGLAAGPEVRFTSRRLELREAADGSDTVTITGEPIVYDTPYTVVDMFGEFEETMLPGVCADVLARADVRFLFNHDGMPLARSVAGAGTMTLTDTPTALQMAATVDMRQQAASDLVVAIERGDVTQMSCGFIVARDKWNPAMTERQIQSLSDLLDVSGVTYPASPTTSMVVAQRMMLAAPVESRARVRRMYAVARELREGKVLSTENAALLTTALEALHTADDVDIPDIVKRLQDIDRAVDDGQAAVSSVLGKANPDGDKDDENPELVPAARSIPATVAERRETSLSFGDQQLAIDGDAVTFTGDPEKVNPVTTYTPAEPPVVTSSRSLELEREQMQLRRCRIAA